MANVLLLGSGKIGRMIAKFLSDSAEDDVLVADRDTGALERLARRLPTIRTATLDAADPRALRLLFDGRDLVISALSFKHNPEVARAALDSGASYFDLTEDIETTRRVRDVAVDARSGQVFMPQCGLAPGFVSVVAHDLTRHFDSLQTVHMRVGALPQFPNNALKYNLTWSTDGLINEYCNPCDAIVHGARREVLPLEGLEQFSLDGIRYEAFNTSGGLGTLCDTLQGKVRELDYKTIRYLGHRDLMAFLLNGLRMRERRDVLKEILEHAIPVTFQDVVIVFCTVTGQRGGQLVQISDVRKIYSQKIDDENWSAIQITTAAGIVGMVELFAAGKLPPTGFVSQEQVSLDDFLSTKTGRYYQTGDASHFTFGDADEPGESAP